MLIILKAHVQAIRQVRVTSTESNSSGFICYSGQALFTGSFGKETGTSQATAKSITCLIEVELVLLENEVKYADKLSLREKELKLKTYLLIALANLELCTMGLGDCD